MKISDDTNKALEFLDYSSGGNLRKRSDIATILEIGATFGLGELVNDIIFYGAACWNLQQTLKRESGRENEAKLRAQSDELAVQLAGLLASLAESGDDAARKRFSDIYLQATPGCRKNLLDLSHDLAHLKSLQKRLKDMAKD